MNYTKIKKNTVFVEKKCVFFGSFINNSYICIQLCMLIKGIKLKSKYLINNVWI